MRRHGPRVPPDAVVLERVNPDEVILAFRVGKRLQKVEAVNGVGILLLADRANDWRTELKVVCKILVLVSCAHARREDFLRQLDQPVRLDGKGRF